jgi:microcystin degradation protein MlrC
MPTIPSRFLLVGPRSSADADRRRPRSARESGDVLLEEADIVVAYETYQHVDADRAGEAVGPSRRSRERWRRSSPVGGSPLTCPIVQATASEPMAGLFVTAAAPGEARCRPRQPAAGLPYADVERLGFSVVVMAKARPRTPRR